MYLLPVYLYGPLMVLAVKKHALLLATFGMNVQYISSYEFFRRRNPSTSINPVFRLLAGARARVQLIVRCTLYVIK